VPGTVPQISSELLQESRTSVRKNLVRQSQSPTRKEEHTMKIKTQIKAGIGFPACDGGSKDAG
jgi:hypothetical protein